MKISDPTLKAQFEVTDDELRIVAPLTFIMCLGINDGWKNVVINPNFDRIKKPVIYQHLPNGELADFFSGVPAEPIFDEKMIQVIPTSFAIPLSSIMSAQDRDQIKNRQPVYKSFRIFWGKSAGYFDFTVNI